MRKIVITVSLLVLIAACATAPVPMPARPASLQNDVVETLHGVEIHDPYRWLEDQEAPATRAWIDEQNRYTDAVLGVRPETTMFRDRVMALLNTDQYTTPTYQAGR